MKPGAGIRGTDPKLLMEHLISCVSGTLQVLESQVSRIDEVHIAMELAVLWGVGMTIPEHLPSARHGAMCSSHLILTRKWTVCGQL